MAQVRRTTAAVLGWVLTVAGVVLFPLPGPGLLLLALGLALLAERYDWAARRVERVRLRALREAAAGVQTPARTAVTVAVTAGLGASGLLWLWSPPPPSWWVMPAWTALTGGRWSGLGQIGSGVVALALVYYSHRRFHGRPEALAALDDALARARSGGPEPSEAVPEATSGPQVGSEPGETPGSTPVRCSAGRGRLDT